MTETKIDATMQQTLLRYERVLQLIDADISNNDFSVYEEHMKHAVSLSTMIDSCVRVKKALQPGQMKKKEDEKYDYIDHAVSSIQARIGDLKKKIKRKMAENLEQQKQLSPQLKVKSPFYAGTEPVLIDITS